MVVLPCEPAGTEAEEIHPIHNGLHMNPSIEERAIKIAKIGSCTDPLPNGPIAD